MQVVSVLNMSNENVFHKKDAIKAIESKKFESHVKEKYVKFLNSWINERSVELMEFTRTMELKFTKNDYQTKIGCCSRGDVQ